MASSVSYCIDKIKKCSANMKLIVASNRLPITVTNKGNGFEYKKASGAFVTGIESLSTHIKFIWIGNISAAELTLDDKLKIKEDCWVKFHSIPFFISKELEDDYDEFCKATLRPLLHSFSDRICFNYPEYKAYKEYNKLFAQRILDAANDDDIVWIHDYHLMLVPEILKKARPSLRVMFFLHTPFCKPNLLKPLVSKSELVRSVCKSDVIGFHAPEYAINFRDAALIEGFDIKSKVKAIPIGIDPKIFRACLKEEATIKKMKELKKRFAGKKVILGVDRIDFIKGLPHKITGFNRFLERNGNFVGEVVLLQIAIPSRQCHKEYEAYTLKVNETVSELNGTIGAIENTPVHFLFNSVNFNELCAIYHISDMVLITSIKDEMNLVALEYVACQDENEGVVVLSKFSGVSATLQGCVEHNPSNTEEIAKAIEKGINLSKEERKEMHKLNRRNLEIFTSHRWAVENLSCVYKERKSKFIEKEE